MRFYYLGYILIFFSFFGSLQGNILDVMENKSIFWWDLDQERARSGVLNFQGKKSSKILLMDTGVFDVGAKIEAGYEEICALLIEPSRIHKYRIDQPSNGPFPKEYFAKILDHIFSTDGVLQKNGLHP
jgi:hypothetical protein